MDFEAVKQTNFIPSDRFTKIRELVKGSFGTISLYHYFPPNSEPTELRAIKLFDTYDEHDFENEMSSLLQLKHPNIVSFFGTTEISDFNGLVMEFMEGGNLSDVIHHRSPYQYSLKDVLSWNLQSAKALVYMHSHSFIHRDVKPQNMLLDSTFQTLKICDFGLSKVIESSRNTTKGIGTPLYMAPEVFQSEPHNDKCDVYSWTLTFWECLTEKVPFRECKNRQQLLEAKMLDDYLEDINIKPVRFCCTRAFNQIIQNCASPDPNNRESMKFLRELLEDICSHGETLLSLNDFKIFYHTNDDQSPEQICLWDHKIGYVYSSHAYAPYAYERRRSSTESSKNM